ncbi:hypothetical protein FLL45_18215 [Aliikangiella marina]|uniref:Uncharacterized protein n=1 Tax=Aliikangiella marina TaxID=1712262 RepID=A0A545T4K1_9GAMM|nr:hypothetical protein [Aliikangiella marina]TQV72156.1 hypothetical protein FLL45_18215 [Aliikangiella marina]
MLSDSQFLTQFENHSLPSAYFDHQGHLRIAWLYLNRFSCKVAIRKVCEGIKSYAVSLGAKDKFHHTLTEFTVRMIAHRLTTQSYDDFADFVNKNRDLVVDLRSQILRYYSPSLLNSDLAKKGYCKPDLIEFG